MATNNFTRCRIRMIERTGDIVTFHVEAASEEVFKREGEHGDNEAQMKKMNATKSLLCFLAGLETNAIFSRAVDFSAKMGHSRSDVDDVTTDYLLW